VGGPGAEAAVEESEFGRAAADFENLVKDYQDRFMNLPLPPDISADDADCVLRDMTQQKMDEFDFSSVAKDKAMMDGLDQVRRRKLEQQILLFHFWNNYGHPRKVEKVQRLREKLEELKRLVDNEKMRIANPLQGHRLAPLYDEMNDSFQKVFDLYQERRQEVGDLASFGRDWGSLGE
jgi:uncharacterized membrane-anchored protein YhcB (DUF1043 family)